MPSTQHVLLLERHPVRSGRQVLRFVTEKKPVYAGVDPYNFYIDRIGRQPAACEMSRICARARFRCI